MGLTRYSPRQPHAARAEIWHRQFGDFPLKFPAGTIHGRWKGADSSQCDLAGLEGPAAARNSSWKLAAGGWVTDMVYVPLRPICCGKLPARGNKTVDGLGMLLHQARPAFAAFFGKDPAVTDDLRRYVLARD